MLFLICPYYLVTKKSNLLKNKNTQKLWFSNFFLIVTIIVLCTGSFYLGSRSAQTEKVITTDAIQSRNRSSQTKREYLQDPNNWRLYTIPELQIVFKLPKNFEQYGEFTNTVSDGVWSGKMVCATFNASTSSLIKQIHAGDGCTPNIFTIAATSKGYGSASELNFTDFQGFLIKDNRYFAVFDKGPDDELAQFEIPKTAIAQVERSDKLEVIKVIGIQSYNETFEMYTDELTTPGHGKIGAYINTNNESYPGIMVVMELNNDLDEYVFDEILASIQQID